MITLRLAFFVAAGICFLLKALGNRAGPIEWVGAALFSFGMVA